MKKRTLLTIIAASLAVGMFAARPADAQKIDSPSRNDESPSYFRKALKLSQAGVYGLRGIKFSAGKVTQAEGNLIYKDPVGTIFPNDFLTATAFVNFDPDWKCEKGGNDEVINEVDATLAYTYNSKDSTFTMTGKFVEEGYIHQKFGQSAELVLETRINNLFATPTFTVVSDIKNGKGTYWGLDLKRMISTELVDLTLQADIGYNNYYWTNFSGPSHYGFNATLSKTIDNCTLSVGYFGSAPLEPSKKVIPTISSAKATIEVGF